MKNEVITHDHQTHPVRSIFAFAIVLLFSTLVVPLVIAAVAPELKPFTAKFPGKHTLENPGGEIPKSAQAFAKFNKSLGISWDSEFLYIEGNGLPDHPMMRGITAWQQQVPIPHDFTGENRFKLPLNPETIEGDPQELTLMGPIALAVNGIPIFHALTQSGKDAYAGGELDEWGGHCGRADDYHYHIAPSHLEATVGKGNPVAFGLDGHPIYLEDPTKDKPLDECHGYFDDSGQYRYVGNLEPPYMMAYFRGPADLDDRPPTRGVREFLRPLRGAKITGFEGSLADGYSLEYDINGDKGHVNYQITDSGVDFKFIEPDGTEREESHERRAGGGGGKGKGKGKGQRPKGGEKGMRPLRPGEEKGNRAEAGGRTPWILVHATEIDANEDGVVEFESEMMAEANRVFAAYDKNNDQKISPDESSAKGGMPKSALGGFVRQHAEELDRDNDGGISKTEMTSQFAKFFGQADKNGDNKLTKDEYEVEGRITPRFPDRKRPGEGRPEKRDDSPSPQAMKQPATVGPTPASIPSVRSAPSKPAPEGAPNFVLFLIDDMGWNAMGFSGSKDIETPRTDAMAREGMIFTNAYASAPNCAPTRACLMSGQYTPRHGVYTVVDERHSPGLPHHKIISAESNSELATESVTIAESMKAGGYRTGMFGMWNLGRGRDGPTTPLGQGFEVFKQPRDFGFDKDRYLNDDGEYLTDAMTAGGIEWIKQNQDKPFFLYMAYHGVHSPYEPKPDIMKKYQNKGHSKPEYAATVEAVDQNVGRIVDALEEMDLSDNTIVIFHSDNGGERRLMAPLRNGKGTVYEGGLRVPTAIWGPGIVSGETAEPMLSMDIYPTMLELAGLDAPRKHQLDGESFASILTGKSQKLNRDRVFWHFPSYIGGGGPSSAMRKGDYKVLEFFETQEIEVYNLATDPHETQNLAEIHPELAKSLAGELQAWHEATGASRPSASNPNFDPNAPKKRGREERGKNKGGKEKRNRPS